MSFAGSLKVFVAVEPCDMRKGFNGLHALVTERMKEDPKAGALFVFTNRRRTRQAGPGPNEVETRWPSTRTCTKRLEEGTFSWPQATESGAAKLRLTPEALALLTDGVDLRGPKLRPWNERE